MKKLLLALTLLAGTALFANNDFTVPHTNPTAAMPSLMGGILFSKTTRAVYISPRVDLSNYQVLGKAKGTVSIWNVLALISMGDTGWDALKREALKEYPGADDIVNFTVDAEYLNVIFIYMQMKVHVSGFAVKVK